MTNQTVLAVFPAREDRAALADILSPSCWKVQFIGTCEEAQAALRSACVGVIITEARLPGGQGWKELLEEVQRMANPPPVIVADRLADESMWAEVLNLGAHDLLMKPFDAKEVLHVVGMAWRRYEYAQRAIAVRKPPRSPKRAVATG